MILWRISNHADLSGSNQLFNPLHPQAARCKVLSTARHPFDGRLPRR